MNILVIDEEFPYPLNTGKRIRSYNLIRRLAERHEVRYLAYGRQGSDSFRALQKAGIQPVAVHRRVPPKSGPVFYLRLLANLLSAHPYTVSSHHSRFFAEALKTCLGQKRADLIMAEWTPYAIYVKEITDIKKLIVAHNIEARIWRRLRENEPHTARRWYIGRQIIKMEQFERAAFQWVDGATAVSVNEAEAITSYSHHLPVEVVENGVDLDYFTAGNDVCDSDQLVFTGAMDWRPNQDAALYFTSEILPLLREKHPNLKTVFVGRNPPRHIQQLDKVAGITITGTVDDVRPYMAKAAVYIVPLRIGGGSRLKIVEALAMQKAVVTTTIGAEGLEVTDGREVLLADTPQQFVQQISKLLSNDELSRQLGKAGRKLVEQRYNWDSLADRLDDFINRLVVPA